MNEESAVFPATEATVRNDWSEQMAAHVDPKAVLHDVVSALQILSTETGASFATPNSLIELHGALLVYELAGRSELLPSVAIGVTTRRSLERRVLSSAHRLAGRDQSDEAAFAAWKRAAALIEDLIDLIDPELRLLAAS